MKKEKKEEKDKDFVEIGSLDFQNSMAEQMLARKEKLEQEEKKIEKK